MSKILLSTYGSYGDLHPYIGMGRVLKMHGYEVVVASSPQYRNQVERMGLPFVPIKPGIEDIGPEESWAEKSNHPSKGAEFVLRNFILLIRKKITSR